MKQPHGLQADIDELTRLSSLLHKYAHRWCEFPSERMVRWVDEYNALKASWPWAWEHYCKGKGLDPSHDAFDCLA